MGMATEDVMEGRAAVRAASAALDLTVLVPVYNESENLMPLLEKLTLDLKALGKSYEILIVDDGSSDDTLARLHELHRRTPNLRAIVFRRNYGKSAALSVGFQAARGRVVFGVVVFSPVVARARVVRFGFSPPSAGVAAGVAAFVVVLVAWG